MIKKTLRRVFILSEQLPAFSLIIAQDNKKPTFRNKLKIRQSIFLSTANKNVDINKKLIKNMCFYHFEQVTYYSSNQTNKQTNKQKQKKENTKIQKNNSQKLKEIYYFKIKR